MDIVVPGERIGSVSLLAPGSGTYVRNGLIYSKLCGTKVIHEPTSTDNGDRQVVDIVRDDGHQTLPEVDSIATCKVLGTNPRMSKVVILSVNGNALKDQFQGVIRKEDVRATEKDRVKMYESFRPGDIVLAKVISLGDARSYYLTTAENELGVIYAVSESGGPMFPISWCKMQCVKTGRIEFRKVAKVKIREV